jgi:hypothetical protein
MLYSKADHQVTCRATITLAIPAALAAITGQDHHSDLSSWGMAKQTENRSQPTAHPATA